MQCIVRWLRINDSSMQSACYCTFYSNVCTETELIFKCHFACMLAETSYDIRSFKTSKFRHAPLSTLGPAFSVVRLHDVLSHYVNHLEKLSAPVHLGRSLFNAYVGLVPSENWLAFGCNLKRHPRRQWISKSLGDTGGGVYCTRENLDVQNLKPVPP